MAKRDWQIHEGNVQKNNLAGEKRMEREFSETENPLQMRWDDEIDEMK